jgi:hypothetical protein
MAENEKKDEKEQLIRLTPPDFRFARQVMEDSITYPLNKLRELKGLPPLCLSPSAYHYRQEMGLLPTDPNPTEEEIERLNAYNKYALDFYCANGKVLPGSFKEVERARKLKESREFQVFSSLDEIFEEWDCKNGKILEIKFIKPATLAEWQSTIYRCATMVKVLKTLNHFMPTNLHRYNFIYQCKTLFKKTTHAFEYNAANYAFIIRTGLGSGGQEVENVPVNFYEQTQEQLHHLLSVMKQELPQSHYEQVFMLYTLIKNNKKAVL